MWLRACSSNANTFRSSNVNVQQQFQRQRSPHSQSCNASCSKTSVGSSAFARQYRFDRSSTLHVSLLSCSPHHRTLKPQGFRCSAPAGASARLPGFTRLRARGFAASFAETAALHCASAAWGCFSTRESGTGRRLPLVRLPADAFKFCVLSLSLSRS